MPEKVYDLRGKKVWVAGHKGMVGSAIVRRIAQEECEVLTADRNELDLLRQDAVEAWVLRNRPDAVFMSAAKVGGILANDNFPADFLYENVTLQNNVIHACHLAKVQKLLFLGSSCIYPKFSPQPITEDALLSGPLEPTNEWYAIAKIAGIKLCQAYRRQYRDDFISAMPTNLYGPGDNFDLDSSHVMPALIRKAHEAKKLGLAEITIWGTGTPRREFLYVDDCADACVYLMQFYTAEEQVNIGCGEDLDILELTKIVSTVVGFNGTFVHDLSKPDGTPRKMMCNKKLRQLGWTPKTDLRRGISLAYSAFIEAERLAAADSGQK